MGNGSGGPGEENQQQNEQGEGDEEEEETGETKDTFTPLELINEILSGGESVINGWHKEILKDPPTMDAFLDPENALKNRFPNTILYDRTRVKLKGEGQSDYYHASYVDSYDRPGGFVLAQCPFDDTTESDFWRLISQIHPCLVVLLSSTNGSNGHPQIRNFWPDVKEVKEYANQSVKVQCNSIDQVHDSDTYELMVLRPGQRGSEGAKLRFVQYKKWIEDKEVPDNLLEFRAFVKICLARCHKENNRGPICLVCPSGVHRCGTFAVLDIILDRMVNERKVGLLETAMVVRKQRYGCMTHFSHYNHVADLLLRFAASSNLANMSRIGS